MKKGFTLVELLAVLVILAIVALIAVPIVLNIISNSRESAVIRSAEYYLNAVDQAISNKNTEELFNPIECNGEDALNLTCLFEDNTTQTLTIEIDGRKPDSVHIEFDTNSDIKLDDNVLELVYDDDIVTYQNKELVIPEEGTYPQNFTTDSWETIIQAFKNGSYEGVYNVGDTKELTVDELGTFTVRLSNLSTPSECKSSNFSKSACGVVIEFVDSLPIMSMNLTRTNAGGWQASYLNQYLNGEFYNSLPSTIKDAIIKTTTISSHGSNNTNNITSTDYIYLTTNAEIYGSTWSNNTWVQTHDTAYSLTRQLDIYSNNSITFSNRDVEEEHSNVIYTYSSWTRDSNSQSTEDFFYSIGSNYTNPAVAQYRVYPVFRLSTEM